MKAERIYQFQKCLSKGKASSLMVELSHDDLAHFATKPADAAIALRDHTTSIFDAEAEEGKTNVLVATVNQSTGGTSIFSTLLEALDDEFDSIYKAAILKKLAGMGLSQTLGETASEAAQEWLGMGLDALVGYLSESADLPTDYVERVAEPAMDLIADHGSSSFESFGEKSSEFLTKRFSSRDNLYLSPEARDRLRKLVPRFNSPSTSHEALQLSLELLLLACYSAPKAIIIEQPDQLDAPSLALLAMWLSHEKDFRHRKEQEDTDDLFQTGLTLILCPGIPRTEVAKNSDTNELEQQRALDHLKLVASRYNLIERLEANIPVPAVRLNTFLGRDEEISLLRHHWDALKAQHLGTERPHRWILVKGEPGTGKTALVHEFIRRLKSDTKNLNRRSISTLRLLNQSGHTVEDTGLASLKNSLIGELRRLALVYEENKSWLHRFRNKLSEQSKSVVIDAISDDADARKATRKRLLSLMTTLAGMDGFIGVARSTTEWWQRDDYFSTAKESLLESQHPSRKLQQFELLHSSILEVHDLVEKTLLRQDGEPEQAEPLILVVDDLQWIDDLTAEFLVNHLPEIPVLIVATTRGADSFSPPKFGFSNTGSSVFKDHLFKTFGLAGETNLNPSANNIDTARPIDLSCDIELRGLDHKTLSLLISRTYEQISKDQADELASSLIDHLVPHSNTLEVNTLFAIEAINVLSDPCFYKRNPDIRCLIRPSENSRSFKFDQSFQVELKTYFKELFEKLEETYRNSYLPTESYSLGGERFNLASFAIFSERLKLIEQYFGESSVAVRGMLYLSTMFGNQFSKDTLISIQNHFEMRELDIQDWNPELYQLVKSMRSSFNTVHSIDLFELLERAFELIIRVAETQQLYAFRHSLLHTFLTGQFFNYLNNLWIESDEFEKGVSDLLNAILETLEDDSKTRNFLLSVFPAVTAVEKYKGEKTEALRIIALVTGTAWKFLQLRGLKDTKSETAHKQSYAKRLTQLAQRYSAMGKSEQALDPVLESLALTEPEQRDGDKRWLKLHIMNLLALGKCYLDLGESGSAKVTLENAFTLASSLHQKYPTSSTLIYVNATVDFGYYLIEMGECERSVELFEQALRSLRKTFKLHSPVWRKSLVRLLSNAAYAQLKLSAPDNAETFLEEAYVVANGHFQADSENWAKTLIGVLNLKCRVCESIDDFERAQSVLEESLDITKNMKAMDPEIWTSTYADTLKNLGRIALKAGSKNQAIDYLKSAKLALQDTEKSCSRREYFRLAFVLDNLAMAYEDTADYQACFDTWDELYRLSSQDFARHESEKLYFQARALIECGRMQRHLTNSHDALKYFFEAQNLIKKLGKTEGNLRSLLEARLLMVHSYTLLIAGDSTEAKRLFNDAKALILENKLLKMKHQLSDLEQQLYQ